MLIKKSKKVYAVSDTFGGDAMIPYSNSLLGIFYTEEDAWHSIEIAMNIFINDRNDNDELVYLNPIIHIIPDMKVVKAVIPIIPIKYRRGSITYRYHEYLITKTKITEFKDD